MRKRSDEINPSVAQTKGKVKGLLSNCEMDGGILTEMKYDQRGWQMLGFPLPLHRVRWLEDVS